MARLSILKWKTRYESMWRCHDKLLWRYLDLGWSGNKNTKNMSRTTCPTLFMPSLLEPIDLHVFFCGYRHLSAHMHTEIWHCWAHLSYTTTIHQNCHPFMCQCPIRSQETGKRLRTHSGAIQFCIFPSAFDCELPTPCIDIRPSKYIIQYLLSMRFTFMFHHLGAYWIFLV